MDLPKLPRSKRAVRSRCTDATAVAVNEERIKAFYTDLYLSVMETGAKALLNRYSKNDLNILELLHRSLEDDSMVDLYSGDIKLDNLRFERNIWFARFAGMKDERTIATLSDKLAEEEALKFIIPNMHILCEVYVCLR